MTINSWGKMVGTRKRENAKQSAMGRVGERPFWLLGISIVIRAVHQVGAAVYLASFLVPEVGGPPMVYLGIALLSGIALFLAEAVRHRQIYREVSGMITVIKLIILGAAFHAYLPAAGAVLTAFILASVGAHAPKNVRHRLLY